MFRPPCAMQFHNPRLILSLAAMTYLSKRVLSSAIHTISHCTRSAIHTISHCTRISHTSVVCAYACTAARISDANTHPREHANKRARTCTCITRASSLCSICFKLQNSVACSGLSLDSMPDSLVLKTTVGCTRHRLQWTSVAPVMSVVHAWFDMSQGANERFFFF